MREYTRCSSIRDFSRQKKNEEKEMQQDKVMSVNRDQVSSKGKHTCDPYSMT